VSVRDALLRTLAQVSMHVGLIVHVGKLLQGSKRAPRPAREPNSRSRPVPELKTKKTTASVQAFLKKAAKGDRYEACQFLLATFEKATKDKAAMWGSAIVGVGAETDDLRERRPA
jgi:hypothetical protein